MKYAFNSTQQVIAYFIAFTWVDVQEFYKLIIPLIQSGKQREWSTPVMRVLDNKAPSSQPSQKPSKKRPAESDSQPKKKPRSAPCASEEHLLPAIQELSEKIQDPNTHKYSRERKSDTLGCLFWLTLRSKETSPTSWKILHLKLGIQYTWYSLNCKPPKARNYWSILNNLQRDDANQPKYC